MIPGYLTGQVRDRPQIGDYTWRARTRPIGERAIARAEAEHGSPVPTCLCGGRMRQTNTTNHIPVCDDCGGTS